MFLPIIKPAIKLLLKAASFVLFLITILSAYGGRINPEYFPYFSWLTLALPYFAIASIVVTAIWLCFGKYITGAIGILSIFLIWNPISTASPVNFSKDAANPERTFKFLTYNIIHGWDQCQGINDYNDIDKQKGNPTLSYLLHSGADILNLQEFIGFEQGEVPHFQAYKDSLRKVYPYMAGDTETDLKVYSKYPVKRITNFHLYSLFEVKTPWGKLNIVNVHLPSYSLSDEERSVMREILSVKNSREGLSELKGSIRNKLNESFRYRALAAMQMSTELKSIKGPLIVAGDFNDVPESYAYRLIREAGLTDAYTETSFGPLITYNRHGFYFHLDQILYRENPLRALNIRKGKLRNSDHYPLIAEFEWQE